MQKLYTTLAFFSFIFCWTNFLFAQAQLNIVDVESCGDNIFVEVQITSQVDVNSVQFTLLWDPALISYQNVDATLSPPGAFPSFGLANTSTGELTYSYFNTNLTTFTTTETLITLEFTTTQPVGATIPVDFDLSPSATTPLEVGQGPVEIPSTSTPGEITVGEPIPAILTCPTDTTVNVIDMSSTAVRNNFSDLYRNGRH